MCIAFKWCVNTIGNWIFYGMVSHNGDTKIYFRCGDVYAFTMKRED